MTLLLLGCGGGNGDADTDTGSLVPPAQGSRVLGMDVKEIPSITYAVGTMAKIFPGCLTDLDSAALTYYPLNTDFSVRPVSAVATDFALMTTEIPGKNILLQECGYPSSPVNRSSEVLQADFISAVFDAWDNHRNRIRLVDLAWQYDVSSTTVDQWVIDFGMTGNPDEAAFRAYLGTLGLGNYDSTEKAAMQRLRDELQARKWVQ